MFQSFDAATSPQHGAARLADLRSEMALENLDGFLVPRADAHQGEYVIDRDARLAWLTGFTGSAGFSAILHKVAGVFIDGRYRLQVGEQIDLDQFTPVHWPEVKLHDWLKQQLPTGGKIGFDPWLHTSDEIKKLEKELSDLGFAFIAMDNLVDRIWQDQPAAPQAAAVKHPIEFAGLGDEPKRAMIADAVAQQGAQATVLTQPDSICWLLNIRGADIARTPTVQAFAIFDTAGQTLLFSDAKKFADLGDDPHITVLPFDALEPELKKLQSRILIDKAVTPFAIAQILRDAGIEILWGKDPISVPKACKNDTELAGAKTAHIRDGVAVCEFLAWLETQNPSDLTEIDVVSQLELCRQKTGQLKDISFETICGSGPNGAIVHYRVTHDSNRNLQENEVLLVDSGAQYQDGTTDITRTIAIGTPPKEAVQNATLVLKGMIAISRATFPVGTCGKDIDALARSALWAQGKDYDHGTGHGVGSYLSVHEGPQGISKRATQAFLPGMVVSNEPGYYKEDAYGIRIENLIYVREMGAITGGDDRDMLGFETLTLVPIDRRMMDISQLSKAEINWLDNYHKRVFETLSPRVDGHVLDWLKSACKPLTG